VTKPSKLVDAVGALEKRRQLMERWMTCERSNRNVVLIRKKHP
jgi:hypothetical protein